MERITEWEAAWDKSDPDPSKDYGIHGVECRWVVKGPRGAIQFLIYTNWMLPHVWEAQDKRGLDRNFPHLLCRPMGADFGYHSRTPSYEGQEPIRIEDGGCPYLDGASCYYDGSGVRGQQTLQLLIEKGGEAVWASMEEEYNRVFKS